MDLKKTSRTVLKISAKMTLYLFMVTALYIVGAKGFEFGEKVFSVDGKEQAPGREVVVVIPKNASIKQVGNLLIDNGLIENDIYAFYLQTFLYEAKFYPGKYTLNTSSNVEDIISKLSVEPVEEESDNQTQPEAVIKNDSK